jgi:hypothetical protein
MKYIYYILGILILITVGLVFRLSGLKIEVSEPALVINDKIIDRSELEDMMKIGSYHSRGKDTYGAIITRELLIQEAIREGIHKEEAFRKSVEEFYEQSLVKILIDRKLKQFSPVITEEMISKYKAMSSQTVGFTKTTFDTEDAYKKGEAKTATDQESDFENLSETLKYSLFTLAPGETSRLEVSDEGYVVYRLNKVSPSQEANQLPEDDDVKAILIDQGKNVMLDSWMNDLKKNADIQILSSTTNSQGGAGL